GFQILSIYNATFTQNIRALSRLVNSIKDPSRFKFTTESIEMELLEYLELRNELFNDIEEVMGSYAQRAIMNYGAL
ncbi:hypothetical protein O5904_25055, partial [Escherichia coli]|nr:hypothetical protein [Escherichia coli]